MGQYLVTVVRKPTKNEADDGQLEEVLVSPVWIQASSAENAKAFALINEHFDHEDLGRVRATVLLGSAGRLDASSAGVLIQT